MANFIATAEIIGRSNKNMTDHLGKKKTNTWIESTLITLNDYSNVTSTSDDKLIKGISATTGSKDNIFESAFTKANSYFSNNATTKITKDGYDIIGYRILEIKETKIPTLPKQS